MEKRKEESDRILERRKRAEERVEKIIGTIDILTDFETKNLIHELQIHQIELEMQNDELQQSQDSLLEARQKYYDLYHFAPVGYLTLNAKGIIEEANLTVSNYFGVNRKQILNQPFTKFIPVGNQDTYYLFNKRLLETREVQQFDIHLKGKEGETFWVHVITKLIETEDGTKTTNITFLDINTRKQAEKALTTSEKKYHVLHDSMMDGFISFDLEGKFIECNEIFQTMVGYSQIELQQRNFKDITPEKWHHIDEEIKKGQVVKRGYSDIFQKEYRRKNGTIFPVELHVVLMRDDIGNPSSMWAIVRDITERKKSEEELHKFNENLEHRVEQRTAALQEANNEMNSFSYSVSHDLRAPLRAIDSFTAMLVEQYEHIFDADAKHLLSLVRSNTTKMDQLIGGLLTLSRIGTQGLNIVNVDMESIARSQFTDALLQAESTRITFTVHPLPSIPCDEVLIRQVWFNLISNAVKYSSKLEHSHIEIGSNEDEELVHYFVKDNGIGFDERYANKLFGIFQRLHSQEEFEGIGIGLSTVKRIIHRFEGKVRAEGELGKGATFWFSLPKVQCTDIDG